LDVISRKPKKAVEHLVSVIKPATLKALIDSKLEMDKSELKKDFARRAVFQEDCAIREWSLERRGEWRWR
jgi:hypothetical protein